MTTNVTRRDSALIAASGAMAQAADGNWWLYGLIALVAFLVGMWLLTKGI